MDNDNLNKFGSIMNTPLELFETDDLKNECHQSTMTFQIGDQVESHSILNVSEAEETKRGILREYSTLQLEDRIKLIRLLKHGFPREFLHGSTSNIVSKVQLNEACIVNLTKVNQNSKFSVSDYDHIMSHLTDFGLDDELVWSQTSNKESVGLGDTKFGVLDYRTSIYRINIDTTHIPLYCVKQVRSHLSFLRVINAPITGTIRPIESCYVNIDTGHFYTSHGHRIRITADMRLLTIDCPHGDYQYTVWATYPQMEGCSLTLQSCSKIGSMFGVFKSDGDKSVATGTSDAITSLIGRLELAEEKQSLNDDDEPNLVRAPKLEYIESLVPWELETSVYLIPPEWINIVNSQFELYINAKFELDVHLCFHSWKRIESSNVDPYNTGNPEIIICIDKGKFAVVNGDDKLLRLQTRLSAVAGVWDKCRNTCLLAVCASDYEVTNGQLDGTCAYINDKCVTSYEALSKLEEVALYDLIKEMSSERRHNCPLPRRYLLPLSTISGRSWYVISKIGGNNGTCGSSHF
jgi:hypothetical protein